MEGGVPMLKISWKCEYVLSVYGISQFKMLAKKLLRLLAKHIMLSVQIQSKGCQLVAPFLC